MVQQRIAHRSQPFRKFRMSLGSELRTPLLRRPLHSSIARSCSRGIEPYITASPESPTSAFGFRPMMPEDHKGWRCQNEHPRPLAFWVPRGGSAAVSSSALLSVLSCSSRLMPHGDANPEPPSTAGVSEISSITTRVHLGCRRPLGFDRRSVLSPRRYCTTAGKV